jgi:hypothetical protein
MLLRLWDLAGDAAPCELTLPDALSGRQIEYADLRGQPLQDAKPAIGSPAISNNKVTVDVTPFAPTSLLLYDNTGPHAMNR